MRPPIGRPKDVAWMRDANAPFDDPAREAFAIMRAKGGTLKAAAQSADITIETAGRWGKTLEMVVRVKELRAAQSNFAPVSEQWIIAQLQTNVEEARSESCYKASNEALKLIWQFMHADKNVQRETARTLDPNVTPQEVQKRLRASFQDTEPDLTDVIEVDAESAGDTEGGD